MASSSKPRLFFCPSGFASMVPDGFSSPLDCFLLFFPLARAPCVRMSASSESWSLFRFFPFRLEAVAEVSFCWPTGGDELCGISSKPEGRRKPCFVLRFDEGGALSVSLVAFLPSSGSLVRFRSSLLLFVSSTSPFLRDDDASPMGVEKTAKRSEAVVVAFACDIFSRLSTTDVSSC